MPHTLRLLSICIYLCALSWCDIWAQTPPPSCTNHRYIDPIFDVSVQYGVNYGNAPAVIYPPYIAETATYNKSLNFDLYTPVSDTFAYRPAIVMVFGGAFLVGGTTLQPQFVEFCRYFARRGYVVAAIDYRLGFNILNGDSGIRAVYRASQDVKSAVRHLKYNAATYGIDTNYVFSGGNSAGGIASIHAAYVSEAERYAYDIMDPSFGGGLFNSWPDLGCVECSGNPYGQAPYNISGTPDLVFSLWGAIADTLFMESASDAPIISFHGTSDNIVLAGTGSPFGYPVFPPLHGSIPIDERASNLGMTHETYLYPGVGHEVWTDSGDEAEIRQLCTNFFYRFLQPAAPTTINGNAVVCSSSIETYSVPLQTGMSYCWQVTGGTILGNANSNSINIQWLPGATGGTISVRAISPNLVESNPTQLNVSIVPLSAPTNLAPVFVSTNRAEVAWTAQAGLQYECEYRLMGTSAWTTTTTNNTSILLVSLVPCQTYEVRVRAVCSGTNYSNYSNTYVLNTECVRVQLRVYLEGLYDPNLNAMRHQLRTANLLPSSQPYNVAPWNYNGGESLSPLPANTSDWVLIEVRDANNPASVLDRSAALLLADGTVRDIDGNPNGVRLRQVAQSGLYYISIKHRNHLGVMTATPILLPNLQTYDFTTASQQAYGNNQQTQLAATPNQWALYAADYNRDGVINFRDGNTYTQAITFTPQYITIDGNGNGLKDPSDFDLYRKNAQIIVIPELR